MVLSNNQRYFIVYFNSFVIRIILISNFGLESTNCLLRREFRVNIHKIGYIISNNLYNAKYIQDLKHDMYWVSQKINKIRYLLQLSIQISVNRSICFQYHFKVDALLFATPHFAFNIGVIYFSTIQVSFRHTLIEYMLQIVGAF